jgi:hypothetical protein
LQTCCSRTRTSVIRSALDNFGPLNDMPCLKISGSVNPHLPEGVFRSKKFWEKISVALFVVIW